MKVPFSTVRLWYTPWQQGIPFDGFLKRDSQIKGSDYTFKVHDFDNWCTGDSIENLILYPIEDTVIMVKDKPIQNLYSIFKLKNNKIQFSTYLDSELGVSVDIVDAEDVFIDGPAFNLSGDEI